MRNLLKRFKLSDRMRLGSVVIGLLAVGSASLADTVLKSHGLSAYGDLKYPENFTHFDYVNPEAPRGGTMSTWGFGTFDSFNPFIVKGQAEYNSTLLYESLMKRAYDEPDAVYGLIAESAEFPPDRSWVIFNLRPEARFADGSPVTAEDVVFSYETLVADGLPKFRVDYKDFETVEAMDPRRVKFTFRDGAAVQRLSLEAAIMPILSKADYADRDFARSSIEPPLTSGPYVVESVNAGNQVVYRRQENYWGDSLPVNTGQNNFDRIVIEYFADYTSAFEGFKGGSYDFREEYYSKIWATSYDFPEIEQGNIIREQILDGQPSGTQGFWFNLRREKFQDPKVRRAISMAFNFEWSNATLFYDLYQRTDSFWENSPLQAEGLPGPAEIELLEPLRGMLPAEVFEEPAFVPKVSRPVRIDRAVLREAGHLLDEAGWVLQDGERINRQGEKLKIAILNNSPGFDRVINPYISTLQQLGLEATNERVDYAQSREREKNFDFDITIRRYAMSLTPGPELHSFFGSLSASEIGSQNISGVANPAIDVLIGHVENASTREELEVAVKALDRALRALHIWVPQWYNGSHNVAYRKHYRHPENMPPLRLGELDFWWYEPE
ncbi:MAG: extracellular solute-binding protein [Rhodobacteraceae bacterium]|nr:extracellular solute-binding protein [Paracoccaceae bacterium]